MAKATVCKTVIPGFKSQCRLQLTAVRSGIRKLIGSLWAFNLPAAPGLRARARVPVRRNSHWTPSWGVPESRVIFTSDRSGHFEIWSIDLRTGAMYQVTRSIRDHSKHYARLSPDGQKLAMVDHGPESWRGALGIVVSPLP